MKFKLLLTLQLCRVPGLRANFHVEKISANLTNKKLTKKLRYAVIVCQAIRDDTTNAVIS